MYGAHACRAGADRVTGAEIGQHMCDMAAEAVVLNGYAGKCIMINKDVRRMDAAAKLDGIPPDMEQKANVCIFEVRTCPHMPTSLLWKSHGKCTQNTNSFQVMYVL